MPGLQRNFSSRAGSVEFSAERVIILARTKQKMVPLTDTSTEIPARGAIKVFGPRNWLGQEDDATAVFRPRRGEEIGREDSSGSPSTDISRISWRADTCLPDTVLLGFAKFLRSVRARRKIRSPRGYQAGERPRFLQNWDCLINAPAFF